MASPPQVDDDPGDRPEPETVKPDAIGSTCPECEEIIFPRGRQQPNAALALHRRNVHGVIGAHSKEAKEARKRRPRAGAGVTPPNSDGRPSGPRSALRGAADAAGAGTASDRPPTQTQWENGLAKLFGYGSAFVASQLVDGDPRIDLADNPEAARAQLVEGLELATEDAKAIARVPSRMLARSRLNRKYGRATLEALDGIDVVFVVGEYFATVARYRRERARMDSAIAAGWQPGYGPPPMGPGGPASEPPAGGTPYAPPPPGTPPPAAPTPGGFGPGPRAGVVVGPEMVAELRRRRGDAVNGNLPSYIPGAGPNGVE